MQDPVLLPDELLADILSHLSFVDQEKYLKRVSRRFHRVLFSVPHARPPHIDFTIKGAPSLAHFIQCPLKSLSISYPSQEEIEWLKELQKTTGTKIDINGGVITTSGIYSLRSLSIRSLNAYTFDGQKATRDLELLRTVFPALESLTIHCLTFSLAECRKFPSSLSSVTIRTREITDQRLPEMPRLRHLKLCVQDGFLDLQENFQHLRLESLSVSVKLSCQLSGLQHMSSLTELRLAFGPYLGLEVLKFLPSLHKMTLVNCLTTDISWLLPLPALHSLTIFYSDFSSPAFSTLSYPLKKFFLSSALQWANGLGFAHLPTTLKHLVLHYPSFSSSASSSQPQQLRIQGKPKPHKQKHLMLVRDLSLLSLLSLTALTLSNLILRPFQGLYIPSIPTLTYLSLVNVMTLKEKEEEIFSPCYHSNFVLPFMPLQTLSIRNKEEDEYLNANKQKKYVSLTDRLSLPALVSFKTLTHLDLPQKLMSDDDYLRLGTSLPLLVTCTRNRLISTSYKKKKVQKRKSTKKLKY